MLKKIAFIGLAAIALTGCNESNSYEITEKNAVTALSASNSAAVRAIGRVGFAAITGDDYGCLSGSAKSNIDGSFDSANGSTSASVQFNDCLTEQGVLNGNIAIDLNWQGYNLDAANPSYDTLTLQTRFTGYSQKTFSGTSHLDGDIELSTDMTTQQSSLGWDISVTSSELDDKSVRSRTLKPLVMDLGNPEFPLSGKFEIDGGAGSQMTATIVANGMEIQVNGGQVTLYSWNQL